MPSCSLGALERQILGARRVGDVPGFEIPARYFQFVRTGDARPLAAVLEHNRLDLLSLAGLTARLLHLAQRGPAAANDAREALALGRVYARAGLDGRARDAFAARRRSMPSAHGAVRVDALRALALAWRRARRYDEAAACWRALLDVPALPARRRARSDRGAGDPSRASRRAICERRKRLRCGVWSAACTRPATPPCGIGWRGLSGRSSGARRSTRNARCTERWSVEPDR